jgi:hypothetical protein
MKNKRENPYKPHGLKNRVLDFIKLDDLPKLIKEKYNGYKLSTQTVEFVMKLAAGQDAMSATQEIYNLGDNRAEVKRRSREMLSNPKIQDMINVVRQEFKHQAIVDANAVLMRLELLYSECIYDNDRNNALKCLKQMSDIVTNLQGSISVNDVTIKFELPNSIKAKQIDIEDTKIED